jgi:hypothetical protein
MFMKKYLRLLFTGILLISVSGLLQAQGHEVTSKTGKSHVFLGAGLVSRYVWRGMQLGGNAPNIQPFFTFKTGGFEAGVWGAFSLSGNNTSQEVDLHVSQSFAKDMFTVTLTDYFFPEEFGDYNYFEYGKDATGHIFEGTLAYNGTKKFPLTVLVATNFYGADAIRTDDDPNSPDFNKKTGIQYSTYFEIGYPFQLKTVDINTFVGFDATTPKKANTDTGYKGEIGFYGNGFGVVNLGFTATKAVQITKQYALPIMVSLVTNPQSGKIYFVFGISF